MRKVKQIVFILTLLFPFVSHANCTSFSFGVNSLKKNEFAFFECKTKQVFQNSDLFLNSKKQKSFFIGESVLTKSLDYKKINKVLNEIIKKSKKKSLKSILSRHGYHLTVGKQTYLLDLKSFNTLKSVLQVLNKNSKSKNGVLVRNKKFFTIKNSLNKGPLSGLKLKLAGDFYYYKGLYWSK